MAFAGYTYGRPSASIPAAQSAISVFNRAEIEWEFRVARKFKKADSVPRRKQLRGRRKLNGLIRKFALIATVLAAAGCTQGAYELGLKPCAPVYGNWCGENYPLSGYDPRAVDSWDRACKRHDECYDSNKSKKYCDRKFQRELEDLSRDRLAPQAMANAHSWFKNDGQLIGFINIASEAWAVSADCKGGDGKRARFYCQTYFGACPLRASSGPGQPGSSCHCGGAPGRIGEQ